MARKRFRVEHLVSAGGVVYRHRDGELEFVLCGRLSPPRWSLPKGTPDPGETLEQTALREVREETGLEVELEAPLGTIEYWFVRPSDGCRCHKTVHFYLMRPVGGSTDRHDPEFDVVQWFPAGEALKALTYRNEAHLVEQAIALLQGQRRGEGA